MGHLVAQIENGKHNVITACAGAMFAASAVLTFFGFITVAEANESGIVGYFIALIISVGACAFFHAFWKMALATLSNERRQLQRTTILIILVCGLPMMICISSWSNVTALVGKPALNMDLQQTLLAAEKTVGEHYKQSQKIRHIIPDIDQQVRHYVFLKDAEMNEGRVSGRRGPGAVHQTLETTLMKLEELRKVVGDHAARSEKKVTQARKAVERARSIATKDVDLDKRLNGVSKELDKLAIVLTDMDSAGLAESVKRTLAGLSGAPTTSASLSDDSVFAKQQKAAISTLATELNRTTSLLSEVADSIAGMEPPPMVSLNRLSPMEAVAKHMTSFIPAWIAGVTLDIGFLFPLLFLMVSKSGLTKEEMELDRVENCTVGDQLRALTGIERTRRLHHKEQRVQGDNNRFFGRDDEEAS